ncbi:MAG: phosphate acetyltransferase [Bacteroidetes bacterium]|nr:phosphate acetyltransferase [Bacteroidota bacterium]
MIRSLDQMVEKVLSLRKKHRIAVAWAHDIHTISAIHMAVNYGLADAIMIGQSMEIKNICRKTGIDHELFTVVESDDEAEASAEAVRMTHSGEADIAMKGLVGTDKFRADAFCTGRTGWYNQGNKETCSGHVKERKREIKILLHRSCLPDGMIQDSRVFCVNSNLIQCPSG